MSWYVYNKVVKICSKNNNYMEKLINFRFILFLFRWKYQNKISFLAYKLKI